MTALPVPVAPTAVPVRLVDVADRLRYYAEQPKAPTTWRTYRSDWRHFSEWCDGEGLAPLPAFPATLARSLYAMAQDGYKAAALQRYIREGGLLQRNAAAAVGL